ncbi:MAG: hypothetical protein LAP21_10245 [Acidobacteriia bacterium]|nr:hypothetical protein [Terriglobia bacterium]
MSTTPSTGPQTPGGMPPAAVPAKKSNVLLWVIGGCGGLILIVVIAVFGLGFWGMHKMKEAGFDTELAKKNPGLAGAKLAVAMNKDLEMVSSDDSAGTIVVRDKKTGKTSTMKFDPEKKTMVIVDESGKQATITASDSGNLEVKGPEGSFKMGASADKPPDWVPSYPGASPKNVYSASSEGEQTGTSGFTTSDAPEKVLSYYGDQLKSGGFKVSTTSNTTDGKVAGIVTAEDSASKRTVMVTASADDKGTNVSVTFSSKK